MDRDSEKKTERDKESTKLLKISISKKVCFNQVDIGAKDIRSGENKSCQMEGVENDMEDDQV